MKLELKHLAPYLPYKLQIVYEDYACELEGLDTHIDSVIVERVNCDLEYIKPILRPLSDLNKEEYADFKHKYNLREIEDWNNANPNSWSLECAIRLFQMHFDVFGLIEKGLAVDINTLR